MFSGLFQGCFSGLVELVWTVSGLFLWTGDGFLAWFRTGFQDCFSPITYTLQSRDRVKLILDKEQSPDNQYHGKTGTIADIEFEDANSATGDSKDNFIYTVELDDVEIPNIHFRRKDLKRVE